MSGKTKIGFDRTIRAEWLDTAVARIVNGDTAEAARKYLWDFLEDVERGTTNSSGRGKTLTVLTRIWISVPPQAEPLRQAAMRLITSTPGEQRIAIHWAMAAATHPFFFDVATNTGKLLKLNGVANRTQIKRRMTETWGDRSTLERTIQHVLKTLAEWGLMKAAKGLGSLVGPDHTILVGHAISELLVHAVLLGQGKGMAVSQVTDHPALFPFKLEVSARDLMRNPLFHVQRQGDQSDIIELVRASSVAA
jgi:hypothetical protein